MAAKVWGTTDDYRVVRWSSWWTLVVEVESEAEERGLVSMKDGREGKGARWVDVATASDSSVVVNRSSKVVAVTACWLGIKREEDRSSKVMVTNEWSREREQEGDSRDG
ncbi:hypothetical protein AMTR_s00020p00241680 [Amborella trichopoda]|uniref:Uncharacterized protein n=1 Tax=Amborella trichopoda TaxID=13333 RepID=W1PW19_AMBTC|nr:hypothetical protein AMTR_s00020p00241680 [Amborella trichopoda]